MAAQSEAAVKSPGWSVSRSSLGKWFRKHGFQLALVTPLVAYVLLFTIAPIFDTFRLSFTGPRDGTFGTVQNYQAIFTSDVFQEAVVNTIIVALMSLALEIGVGLTIALALHTPFRGRGFARTVVLVPLGVPTIVSGAIMLLIFARAGFLNSLAFNFVDLVNKIPGVNWEFHALGLTVAGGWKTLFTVAIADMWKVLPVMVLIFLAGLQALPEDIYEAADVDGATKWQRFWRITLPLLIPYITMAIILRAIDAFRIFELALVLAGGIEPVLGTFIANRYLPPVSDPYTAASSSIVLFAIIMVFIVLYLRFVASRGEVQR
jgi:trehalose transport system permease protein